MKNNFKRCLALLMALMMVFGTLAIPVTAAAEACDHNYVEWKTIDATCTEKGRTLWRCTKCFDYIDKNIVLISSRRFKNLGKLLTFL